MAKKQFQAEAQRLLDLMVNSIYTHKEIFLRELISNASDAIDKIYYKALTDENIEFNKDDYYIKVIPDRQKRTLTVEDTGIGMTKEELEENLGTIAKSGSLAFKQEHEIKDGYDIIGQFGVGFYSAFMVAKKVTVISKALGSDEAYKWEAEGADGYTIEPCTKEKVGTEVILHLKENTEDEFYDDYLNEYRLRAIIKKYSDFIRYPIKMKVTKTRLKEGSDKEIETYVEEEIINSMVPIWRKNKNELKKEDYENFYREKHFGFDKPLTYLHINAEGTISYRAILYIPESIPFAFYTKDYEKGLELYANGVLIMSKCPDLLPDYFSFVKGLVDSEDLSLNISREMLQHDRQLQYIAKNIKNRIKKELEQLLHNEREKYEKFFQNFGRQLKYGVYMDYGQHKEDLQDLLLFYSSKEKKLVTLEEYVSRMPAEQKYIYYAAGESVERISKLPQTERIADLGYEILYFTDDIDEFAIRMLHTYKGKEFRPVAGSDLGLEAKEEKAEKVETDKEQEEIFRKMKAVLGDKVKEVKASQRLKSHPVCLATEGDLTIEMEKVLKKLPHNLQVKAEKILEINTGHQVFTALKNAFAHDEEKFKLYTELLYNQALLIEGLPVEDPVALTEMICRVMV
ncbi:MAG: molecular chaperone HtpG [Firmicutes bacterium]|nr:molecular chaperone HtpG [Bacillota bacterium]